MEMLTCKVVFPVNAFADKQKLEEYLSKFTEKFSVANYYPSMEIGCNTVSLAVIDFPSNLISFLNKGALVNKLEVMETHNSRPEKDDCCSSGGCGSCKP